MLFFDKLMKYIFAKRTKILEGNQLLKMGMIMGETWISSAFWLRVGYWKLNFHWLNMSEDNFVDYQISKKS